MIFGSVCSGIEAASCAWHPLGWQTAFVSEIEPFPCAVLAHHYPSVPNLGSMTQFKDWPDATLDLLVGGTPCQSFSIAGLRNGLADPRGNLMLTYLAIADKYRPRWLVWENVPGVLSSNGGRDFGTFLGGLAELGYGFAYRILDAQYFGVPQRRRRVFVVGHLGDWRRAAAVLFERHSLQGNPAPRREAGEAATCTMVAHPLRAQAQSSHRADSDNYIAHSLRGEGFDASEDGTGRGTPLVPMAIQAGALRENSTSGPGGIGVQTGIAYTLEARAEVQVVAFDTTQITSKANGSNPQMGAPCHPLAAVSHPPAIAFDCKASGQNGFGVGEIASTLRSMGHAGSHHNGGGHQAIAYTTKLHNTSANNAGKVFEERSTCLDAGSPPPALLTALQVRRLSPRECERLQGFRDDYTLIPYRGKPSADGPRYKALGNSMAVPVMRWIGERIDLVDSIALDRRAA